jgi:hypothetical protein
MLGKLQSRITAVAQAKLVSPLIAPPQLTQMPKLHYSASPLQRRSVDTATSSYPATANQPIANAANRLPQPMRQGMEAMSGVSLADVEVVRNSNKPAQLEALAYAQGKKIHLGPGQDRHLPHEAWHVVQQRQGRVKPTRQVGGVAVNDDAHLEAEADTMGKKSLQMHSAHRPVTSPLAGTSLVLQKVKWEKKQIGSSKFRHHRRLQRSFGGSRNIATIKLVRKTGKGKKLYLLARSMGMGNAKLRYKLGDRKRGHSEAVLAAVLKIGRVKVAGKSFDLSKYKIEYASSSNQACQHKKGGEDCETHMAPLITPDKFYFANDYSGGSQSNGFEKLNNKHQKDVNDGYESEEASDDGGDVVVVKDKTLRDLDLDKNPPNNVEGTLFRNYLMDGAYYDKRRNKRYRRERN